MEPHFKMTKIFLKFFLLKLNLLSNKHTLKLIYVTISIKIYFLSSNTFNLNATLNALNATKVNCATILMKWIFSWRKVCFICANFDLTTVVIIACRKSFCVPTCVRRLHILYSRRPSATSSLCVSVSLIVVCVPLVTGWKERTPWLLWPGSTEDLRGTLYWSGARRKQKAIR